MSKHHKGFIATIIIKDATTYSKEWEIENYEAERALSKAAVFLSKRKGTNIISKFEKYLKKDFEALDKVLE